MRTTIELPQAFSVRDEHELFPIQHLVARMHPKLAVVQVATGVHVDGGCTVFWGIVYHEDHVPSQQQIEAALREAGFDFTHNVLTQVADVRASAALRSG